MEKTENSTPYSPRYGEAETGGTGRLKIFFGYAAGVGKTYAMLEAAHQAQKERLYRSLLVSNLITIHLKSGIGKLSAYCGVVSAGCGAIRMAGICALFHIPWSMRSP